jgi:hypothetical protein
MRLLGFFGNADLTSRGDVRAARIGRASTEEVLAQYYGRRRLSHHDLPVVMSNSNCYTLCSGHERLPLFDPSRHCVAVQQLNRFRSEADIDFPWVRIYRYTPQSSQRHRVFVVSRGPQL